MKRNEDFQDFVIRWDGHQKFKSKKIIENDILEVIVQKLEMLLFTNQKEIYGQEGYNVGANLEYYLWSTKISNDIIKGKISQQINAFIPELNLLGYDLELKIFEGEVRDILELYFTIKGYNITFIFE